MSSNKKFPKKKVVKFRLAPRSQKDPLAADDEAPQNVLVPIKSSEGYEDFIKSLNLPNDVFPSEREDKVGMLERAHNADGITLDSDIINAMGPDFQYGLAENIIDDDFFQQAGGLVEGEDDGELVGDGLSELSKQLLDGESEILHFGPSTSSKHNNRGKHKLGDNEDEDEDDDSYDSDEDDQDSDEYNVDEDESNWMDDAPDNNDDLGRKLIMFKRNQHHRADNRDKSDSKSVFTDYSMTSSILRKNNEGLQKVDDHFEKLYERYYANDNEIGSRDMDDVQGKFHLKDPQQIKGLLNEVKKVRKKNHGEDYKPEIVSNHYKLAIIGEDPDGEEDLVEMEVRQRENRVDCESILTFNSTLYNHPKLIVEPRRKKRNSSRASDTSDQDMMAVDDDDDTQSKTDRQSVASSRLSVLSKLSVRPPNESQEEKRARKKALKMFRHQRRQERKGNQKIFKLEEKSIVNQHNQVAAMRLA